MENIDGKDLDNIVLNSTMLLSFEGWIKYIEGFSRGLQTTKTVDATEVFDCVSEIMEYMKTLKNQIYDLLGHCEEVLEKEDTCNQKINDLEVNINCLVEENKQLTIDNEQLINEKENLKEENEQLKETLRELALKMKEKNNGRKM